MSRTFTFNNQPITIPGVYSFFRGDVENPQITLASGNALIIDTGINSNYTHGSGINGEFESGKNSINTFTNSRSFQRSVAGGELHKISDFLFNPEGGGNGVTSLTYVLAATTVAPSLTLTFDGGSEIVLKSKKEGVAGNGVLDAQSKLLNGYSVKLSAGRQDASAYRLKFFQGSYKGTETAISVTDTSVPVDGVLPENAPEQFLFESPDFKTVADLANWIQFSEQVFQLFEFVSYTEGMADNIVAADLTAFLGNQVFSGGTSSFSTADLDSALDAIQDQIFDFLLLLDSGSSGNSPNNIRIFNFFSSEVPNGSAPSIFVGGYNTSSTLRGDTGSSKSLQAVYDSELVKVVHGSVLRPNPDGRVQRNKEYNALAQAAFLMGIEAGLPPQVPSTYKRINISGLGYNPNQEDQIYAVNNGITLLRSVNGRSEVLLDTNTLSRNENLINQDATSFAGSVVRIKRQIAKELNNQLRVTFLQNPLGPNRFTVSPGAVSTEIEAFFKARTAVANVDNLILGASDIVVTTTQDRIEYSVKLTINGPINYILGTISIS